MDNTMLEDIRLQIQTDIQTLFTYGASIKESTVIQEFRDVDEIYPCTIIDVQTGSSPSRHVGRNSNDIVRIDIYMLSLRPTLSKHIVTCEDSVKRSGRDLVEYLAVKLNNYLKNYRVLDGALDFGSELVLNTDAPERENVFKTLVRYEILI